MVSILGYNKIHSKKTDKDYMMVYYSYPDMIDFGVKTGNAICGVEYFNRLMEKPDSICVGYDREKRSEFLYLK